MSTVAMSGNDSMILNGRVFNDLADQDAIALTFPNDIAKVTVGKNGNAIYALDETGRQAQLVVRVVRGSSDDKFLNNLLVQQQNNFAGTVLMFGQFIKQIGDGAGNITQDKYILSGGVFTKPVEGKDNVAGDTSASISMYTMMFSNAPRAIG